MNTLINIVPLVAIALGQIETSALATYGPLGIMCAWFMWRAERLFSEIAGLGHRIDGLTRALLVDMSTRESCGIQTKAYAKEAIAKIDARAAKE